MMNIKPVSDLRDYNKLLKDVKPDELLFLTKNGRGMYAVISIEEYEKFKLGVELAEIIAEAEKTDAVPLEDAFTRLGI